MRHAKKFNHLSRKKAHRESLLANMTISLILKKRIFTTLAKAKALRVYAEPLINRAKNDTLQNRRLVFSYLQNKEAIKELFNDVAQKIAERPGGYTRILKTGHRLGDNAKTCFIELVDYNEAMLKDKKETKAKATRRSRRSKAKNEVAMAMEAPTAAEKELPAAEEPKTEAAAPAAEEPKTENQPEAPAAE